MGRKAKERTICAKLDTDAATILDNLAKETGESKTYIIEEAIKSLEKSNQKNGTKAQKDIICLLKEKDKRNKLQALELKKVQLKYEHYKAKSSRLTKELNALQKKFVKLSQETENYTSNA